MLPLQANCKRSIHFLERLERERNCSRMPRKGMTFMILRMEAESRGTQLSSEAPTGKRNCIFSLARVWFSGVTRPSSSQLFLNSKLKRNHEGFLLIKSLPTPISRTAQPPQAAHFTRPPSGLSPSLPLFPQQQQPQPHSKHRMQYSTWLSKNRHHCADDTQEPEVGLQEVETIITSKKTENGSQRG